MKIVKAGVRRTLRSIRRRNDRNLFWWRGPPRNAGDWAGPFLYRAITSREPIYREPSNHSLVTTLMTVGSLSPWIRENSIVWGSGLLERNASFWCPYKTTAVRGPYTRQRFLELGYPCPEIFGDPSLLLPLYLQVQRNVHYRVGIVPHHRNIEEAHELFGMNNEVYVIDIRWPLETVVAAIASCSCVVSSSLHGLIFAHAYHIPAAQVDFTEKLGGDGVKFLDYYASIGTRAPTSLRISNGTNVRDLEIHATDTPPPELEPLRVPLLQSCPYRHLSQSTESKSWGSYVCGLSHSRR